MDVQNIGVGGKNYALSARKKIKELLDRKNFAAGIKYDSSSLCVFNKMLEIRTEVSGFDRDMRTTIVNMVEIARALGRPAFYTCEYIGFEVGARSFTDEDTEKFQIHGDHSAAKLAGAIHKFIKKFVECYECGLPETEVVIIRKSRSIRLKCGACGCISHFDMREKLAQSIRRDHYEAKQGFRFVEPERQDFKIID